MPTSTISMLTVPNFTQSLAELFGVRKQQNRKITAVKSYTAMQDRYALLAGMAQQPGDLVALIIGKPILSDDIDTEYLEKRLRTYLEDIQHLVSWFQVLTLVQGNGQVSVNKTLVQLFAVPQLAYFICKFSEHLPSFSPLNQFRFLLTSVAKNQFDPIASCQAELRGFLKRALDGLEAPKALRFYKTLKSLDKRATRSNAAIRADLITLNNDLNAILPKAARINIINHLSGIYSGMMIINRLKNQMEKTVGFQFFLDNLMTAMNAYAIVPEKISEISEISDLNWKIYTNNFNFYKSIAAPPSSLLKYVGGDGLAKQIWLKNQSLHAVNEDFFAKFNAARTSNVVFQQAANIVAMIENASSDSQSLTPYKNEYFNSLISICNEHLEFGVYFDVFLSSAAEDIAKLSTNLNRLIKSVEKIKDLPMYFGVKEFINGFCNLRNDDLANAEVAFKRALDLSDNIPLGIIRRQSAAMCLGFKIKNTTKLTPKSLNPLLTTFIDSCYQKFELSIGEEAVRSHVTEDFNLHKAINIYNDICRSFMKKPNGALIENIIKYNESN